MKSGLAKHLPMILATVVLMLGTGTAIADSQTKPYIKNFGADLMAGGWFSSGNGCATGDGTDYQSKDFFSTDFPKNDLNGGILTYTNTGQRGGDSSQYAAFSVGKVDGARGNIGDGTADGFYSSGALAGQSAKALTFANTDNPYGGLLDGSIPQGNCIPDYFSKVNPSTAKPFDASKNWRPIFNSGNPNDNGTYYTDTSGALLDIFNRDAVPSPLQIKAGTRIAIFVKGDVYIDKNIVYDGSATVDMNSVPKFALVVKGSIYIDKDVTELDGLYVAEPADNTQASVAANTGIIWTCHPKDTNKIEYTYPPNCSAPLVVNGALIAKQVDLLRVNGNIKTSNTGDDNLSTVNSCISGSCNLSEVVNYTPAMIMGGSFFDTSNNSSGNTLPIDSLVSLPPVF